MKNLEFEKYGTEQLNNEELRSIDGGFDPLEWLDSHWQEIKRTFAETYARLSKNCDCNIAKEYNTQK